MALRNIIDEGQKGENLPSLFAGEGADVEVSSGDSLLEQLESALSNYGTQDVAIITRSNKRATMYNLALRSQVFCYDDILVKGELLIICRNNYLWAGGSGGDFIANGDIAEVVSINGRDEMYGLRFADVSLRLVDRPGVDIDCKLLLDLLTADVEVVDSETYEKRCTTTEEVNSKLSKGAEADYSHYTNQRKKAMDMRKDPWLNALQVRYAYAQTCHKAQGGQWDYVFLDAGYMPQDVPSVDMSRWLYTAITRARKHLYLINYPAVKSL